MKKGTAIFLIVLATALTALAGVCLMEMKRMASVPNYKIVRDTVYIDRSRERNVQHEHQLELDPDSIYVYDAQRLVAVLDAWEGGIDSVIIEDNR